MDKKQTIYIVHEDCTQDFGVYSSLELAIQAMNIGAKSICKELDGDGIEYNEIKHTADIIYRDAIIASLWVETAELNDLSIWK